jgi:phage gp45-like
MNTWQNQNISVDGCILEFIENDNYKAQAEVIKKENIFTEQTKLFGDYNITVTVYDNATNRAIDKIETLGLNANEKQMKNRLNKMKSSMTDKYFSSK